MTKTNQNTILEQELRWWINVWDATLRQGRYWNPDTPELLGVDPEAEMAYESRRWMEAKAQGLRILKETEIREQNFFKGKIVMAIGPGPVGFLEGCDARIKLAIEPLANAFRYHKLLLPIDEVVYLNTGAEEIPLMDDFVEIAVSRNSLDHVEHPQKVLEEIWRVLRPEGRFILNVDIEHETRPLEPHAFSLLDIERFLTPFHIQRQKVYDSAHGGEGRMFVALCIKPK